MNTPRYLVTHGGKSHCDELLAISVVLAKEGLKPIFRRDPSSEEINNPEIWVIDIGWVADATRGCFDHHQLRMVGEPTCALTLILEHYGLIDTWRNIYDWLPVVELWDTNGPQAVATKLDTSVGAIFKLFSPIEKAILTFFEEDPNAIAPLLKQIGEQLISFSDEYVARLDWLRENAKLKRVPNADYYYLWIPRPEAGLPRPELALREFRDEILDKSTVDIPASIGPDPRSTGYGLYRYDDDPRIDFTRLKGHEQVAFVHANGFYATTPETDPAIVEELLAVGCGIDTSLLDTTPHTLPTDAPLLPTDAPTL